MSERIKKTAKTPETKRGNTVSKARKPVLSQPVNSPIDQILYLQRTIGNQAVQRLMQGSGVRDQGSGVRIQTRLRIGQTGDKYEQEADRAAEQVMRMPETDVQRQPVEEEEETLQAKEGPNKIPVVTRGLESNIQSLRGSGQPLPKSTRNFFEPRFGYNFNQVQVHTDARASELAQDLNARAFTVGRDIVFGTGQYVPDTVSGRGLMAHELSHVVQQKSGSMGCYIQREDHDTSVTTALPPSLSISSGFVAELMKEQEAPVRRWLDSNISRLRLLSMSALVRRVRRNVPESVDLPDIQIQNVIRDWAVRHHITMPPISVIPETGLSEIPTARSGTSFADSELVSTLRRVLSIPTEINIERPHGRVNISVSGATVELRRGALRVGSKLSWGGTMGIYTSYSGLSFSGSLSSDQWKMGVSYSLGSSMPNLVDLANIFRSGESSLRGIVDVARGFHNIDDVSAVSDAISPHVKAVKSSVKVISQIAKARHGRVSLGISAAVSGGGPGAESSAPGGFQFRATLTITF